MGGCGTLSHFDANCGKIRYVNDRYTSILTLAKLKYSMSKNVSTKTLQSCTAANNTKRHSEYGKGNIFCKVKPDKPIENVD